MASDPAGDFLMIELPTTFGPAFMPNMRFASGLMTRPPQLQAATSTNIELSIVDVSPDKPNPVDAFAVVNVAPACTGRSAPVNVRAHASSKTNMPPLV